MYEKTGNRIRISMTMIYFHIELKYITTEYDLDKKNSISYNKIKI